MRYFLLTLSLVLTACDLLGGNQSAPQSVVLRASQREGEIPLTVTFEAEASPAASTFSWAIGGERQTETSSTFTTTFDRSGLYVVTVSAKGASDGVTIAATALDAPNDGPTIGDLKLSQTPGGAAPWAVRYTVSANTDLGSATGLEARCAENRTYRQVVSETFACVHNSADTVAVRLLEVDGEIAASTETRPDITQNDGVAFAGRWRYSSRGVTETFAIVRGSETSGESADGRFKLFTVGQREGTVVEFTIDGRTVVLTPTPDERGKQLYEGEVYGLMLEPLESQP